MTLLHKAASLGCRESTARLLSLPSYVAGINERERDERDGTKGYTALMIAAHHGHSQIVRILLSKGANISITGTWLRFSALHCSACNGHLASGPDKIACGGWRSSGS